MVQVCAPENTGMPITVSLFGGGRVAIGDVVIRDSAMRCSQVWNFLDYLITFRHKTISQEELVAALWEDGEIDDPASALKNLAYRVRVLVAEHGVPFAKKIILFSGGGYQWNNSLICKVDTEQMENYHKLASDAGGPIDCRIENYMQAVALYTGDFLPGSAHRGWVIPVASYYRSLYFKCVYGALELLALQERYADVEMICKKALIVDQYEENVHKHLLMSLIKQGQKNKAIAHYKFVADLFLRELGVNPSAGLRSLYRQIVKASHSVEIDVGVILQDLKETETVGGAFYCEYEVFKNIYQVKARAAPQNGHSIFIALLTVTDDRGGIPDSDIRKRAMDGVFKTIRANTRRCDVFTRFSVTQYVMILSTTSAENCATALGRITDRYRAEYKVPATDIHTKIQPIEGEMLDDNII